MEKQPEIKQPRKRGPKPKGFVDTHVLLPPALRDWATDQPEGLGGVMRYALELEQKRRKAASA